MSYEIGQCLGGLTVTRLEHGSVATQVRCDCGATVGCWLEFSFHAPPGELGDCHARHLVEAEAGRLRYDSGRYPIHALPSNAIDAMWRGLLIDAPGGGPVLTELGAHLLAHWRERQPTTAPAPEEAAVARPTPQNLSDITEDTPPLTGEDLRLVASHARPCLASHRRPHPWGSVSHPDDSTLVLMRSDQRGVWASVTRYAMPRDSATGTRRGEHVSWERLERTITNLAPQPAQDAQGALF